MIREVFFVHEAERANGLASYPFPYPLELQLSTESVYMRLYLESSLFTVIQLGKQFTTFTPRYSYWPPELASGRRICHEGTVIAASKISHLI
jgi:hypothetical protein